MTSKTSNKKLNTTPDRARSSQGGGAAVADWPEESRPETRPQTRHTRPPAAVHVNWPNAGADSMARRFGMDEHSLAARRQFIRLGEEDRQVLGEMAPWAQEVAPNTAHDFYEWQFQFSATRQFFEGMAAEKGISISALRELLERIRQLGPTLLRKTPERRSSSRSHQSPVQVVRGILYGVPACARTVSAAGYRR